MNKEQAETLEVTQQVLRYLVRALAIATRADTDALVQTLLKGADAKGLDPAAQLLLADLARAAQLAGRETGRVPPGH